MILSKRYKEELNKIVMTENMKKRILHNVLNENIKIQSERPGIEKYSVFIRKVKIIALCFIVVISFNVMNMNNQLNKYDSNNLKQEEINDTNNDSKEVKISKSYDKDKEGTENSYIQNDKMLKEYDSINKYNSNVENYKKSDYSKYNESKSNDSNNNDSDNNDNRDNDNDKNRNYDGGRLSTVCGSGIKECKTLEEAEDVIKLKINHIKEIPAELSIHNICVIGNDTIEIEYNYGKDIVKFRAGKVTGDISGDYNEYEIKNTHEIDGTIICLEGYKNKVVNLATWKKDDVSYSISSKDGINEESIINIIMSSLYNK
ncbi:MULTISPECIES: hypothetical protein [Clostridium]|uniref:DUF4367 domain-containing protein n=1 Tax=Clostridium cibarium TaxID=2762247 RepID=A0ABR8PU96_9CLOT|nr:MULTISPECIES: hypothetical protein [Clostridium]MBD7911729.1 hypothetical protein [Clostridium cibarium]